MLLKKIELSNFKIFYRDQSIEFSTDLERNVTVIYGLNGSGKTTIIQALNWVLYGKTELQEELFNKKALKEASAKYINSVKTKVKLYFSHLGIDYNLIREIEYYPFNAKEKISQSKVALYRDENGKQSYISNPEEFIESILPKDISPYFFFDGERIEEFAKDEHDNEVRKAIAKVVGVSLIENAIKHCETVKKEYAQNVETSSIIQNEIKNLEKKIEEEENKINNIDAFIEKFTQEITKLEEKIKKIDEELKKNEEAKKLTTSRDELKRQKEILNNQLEEVISQSIEKIKESHKIIVYGKLMKFKEEFLTKFKPKEIIPAEFLNKLIQKSIEDQRCYICGREITDEKILLQREVNSFDVEIESVFTALIEFIKTYNSLPILNDLNSISQRIFKLQDEIEDIEEKIKKISDKLSSEKMDQEIRNLENEKESLEKKVEDLKMAIKEGEIERSKSEENLRNLRKMRNDKVKSLDKRNEVLKKKIFTENIIDLMKDMKNKFIDRRKNDVEKNINEIFNTLIRKENNFRIYLNDDFSIKVESKYGEEKKSNLSGGERQLLSLSFIIGMCKTSGYEVPLVIDAPFGRLDDEHKLKVAKEIPYLSNQIILITVPNELNEESKKALNKKIGKSYRLEFDHNEAVSYIYPE
jgi:DNA sulfur modification protein DndD